VGNPGEFGRGLSNPESFCVWRGVPGKAILSCFPNSQRPLALFATLNLRESATDYALREIAAGISLRAV
jgi:hypothetical protein